jgi:hypothetical protein
VQLRDIRPLQQPGGAHSRVVEIGSSANVLNMPVLTATDLKLRPIPSTI